MARSALPDATEGFGLRRFPWLAMLPSPERSLAFLLSLSGIGPRHGRFVDRLGPNLRWKLLSLVVWRDLEEVARPHSRHDQLDLESARFWVHEDHGLDVYSNMLAMKSSPVCCSKKQTPIPSLKTT